MSWVAQNVTIFHSYLYPELLLSLENLVPGNGTAGLWHWQVFQKPGFLRHSSFLPLGFCSFYFILTGRELRQHGQKVPLVLFSFLRGLLQTSEEPYFVVLDCFKANFTCLQSQYCTKKSTAAPLYMVVPTCQQCPVEGESESPLPTACCVSSWKGEALIWVPAGLSYRWWSDFFDRAAATREIGRAFVWFWTLGFLCVLPLFSVACCLGGVFVIMEVWFLCCFGVFFLSFCSPCPHAVERGKGLPQSLSLYMQSFMEGAISGRWFSLKFLFVLVPRESVRFRNIVMSDYYCYFSCLLLFHIFGKLFFIYIYLCSSLLIGGKGLTKNKWKVTCLKVSTPLAWLKPRQFGSSQISAQYKKEHQWNGTTSVESHQES